MSVQHAHFNSREQLATPLLAKPSSTIGAYRRKRRPVERHLKLRASGRKTSLNYSLKTFVSFKAPTAMRNSRFIIVLIGVLLPYAARLPHGIEWLHQYTNIDLDGLLFFGALNAIAWGAILVISFMYRRPVSLIAPCLLGFGFLAWAHGILDLRADAQAAIALIFIPIYALGPIVVGGVIGYIVDRRLRRYDAA